MTAASPLHQIAPTRARPSTLDGADGQPVAALVATPPDGRPARATVLLVPGYTGGKEDFAPILDPLSDAGLAVLAIDLPGQFQTPGPDDVAAYTPDALATTLVVLAGALRSAASDAPIHLLGHSFGGLVARAAVLAAPAAFDALVLLDSGPAAISGGRRALIEALEPVFHGGGLPAVYAATLAANRRLPGWVDPPAPLADLLERRFVGSTAAGVDGMGRAIRAEPDRVDELAAVLDATGTSALVACGVDDDAWPVDVQHEMATRLGAAFAVIPEAAHSPAVENPAGLLEVVLPFWQD